jgi:hypothetical protein
VWEPALRANGFQQNQFHRKNSFPAAQVALPGSVKGLEMKRFVMF